MECLEEVERYIEIFKILVSNIILSEVVKRCYVLEVNATKIKRFI